MEKQIIHRANDRGMADHGWLKAAHSFSFAAYHNPEKMHFGVLRVLNDDIVSPGMGFGKHPHDNMEIITIPLSGALEHQDSMGHKEVITTGEVQVMSAGTGVTHSEYNASKTDAVNLLQLWIFSRERNVSPRYAQQRYEPSGRHNQLQEIVTPGPKDTGLWIYQDAWLHLGTFDAGVDKKYNLHHKINGVYIFIISGEATINGTALQARDAIGISETNQISINAISRSEILVIEVPMI